MNKIKIGEYLKGIREEKGYTKNAMKNGAGFSNVTQIDDIEKARSNYTIDVLIKYCDFLRVDAEPFKKEILSVED